MSYEQMTLEDVLVNRIKSAYRTLDNYRKTSMTAHNRPIESVRLYAAARKTEVDSIAFNHPEYAQVQRWAQKFDEYLNQYGLSE